MRSRAFVGSLIVIASAAGCTSPVAPPPRNRSFPGCPSEAGCGPSVYGVAMLTGCGGAHPVSGGVVLAYRAHDDARGSVVDNWSLTDANGMYSFPLGEHAHYRIVLVGPGGEQLSIGPEGGRGSQFHPIDTVDDPIRLDLDATVGCM